MHKFTHRLLLAALLLVLMAVAPGAFSTLVAEGKPIGLHAAAPRANAEPIMLAGLPLRDHPRSELSPIRRAGLSSGATAPAAPLPAPYPSPAPYPYPYPVAAPTSPEPIATLLVLLLFLVAAAALALRRRAA